MRLVAITAGALAGALDPVEAQLRDSVPPWRRWSVGGSVGYRSLGGDFRAAGGPSGEFAVGLVGPGGAAIDFGLRGDIHGTSGPYVYVLSVRAEPRYVVPVRGGVAPFIGGRASADVWGFRVANPVSLGWTDISAGGLGVGATVGMLAGKPGQRIHLVFAVTWDRVWFGDAGSDAFTFSDTSAKAQQWGFDFGLRVRLEKRERKASP